MQFLLPVRIFLILLSLFLFAPLVIAQSPVASPYFARRNTFSIFGAYSNDSSHILLGEADNRKLLDIGVGYNRRIILNRIVNWQYSGEILPVALESDPVLNIVINQTSPIVITSSFTELQPGPCIPGSESFSVNFGEGVVYSGTETITCGRRWTIGEAISPVGMQWNFLPRKKIQPFISGHGGYMYSTQPIPQLQAGSFNFTFDLGAGVELYRSKTRSVRAEYRYHHISNHETALQNPGIDNGLLQVTYSFGR
ncbi:MAG: acyloxyacyl hydrolase [Terracidiphilus sp.]